LGKEIGKRTIFAGVMSLDKPIKIKDSETDEKPIVLKPLEKVPNGTKVR
jgi:hypothetical protein